MDLRDVLDAVDEEAKDDQPAFLKRDEKADAEDLRRIQPAISILLFARVVALAAMILFVGVLGFVSYLYIARGSGSQVFCPQDTRTCSDGSSVHRVGPNCGFPACPGEEAKPFPQPTPSPEISP